jgi:hypothetical protein
VINVVHITENPIAGAPMNLSLALNRYQGEKVSSRHIAASDRNDTRVYKSDLLLGVHSYDEIRTVMEAADIFHFHNFYKSQELFRKYPGLWQTVMARPRVWQVHSQRDIRWMPIEEGLNDHKAKHLVIGQYHPREWPECTVVPNVIDIYDADLLPEARSWEGPLKVAYSPSRIGLTGWDNKGYEVTLPVLQRLVDDGVVGADLIFGERHDACLRRRGLCHIAIDEIVTGSYHLVSLEALSQGCVTIAGLDETQVKTLKDLTGAESLPWIFGYPETLEVALRDIAARPEDAKIWADHGRVWMEKYWHPKDMTQRFVDIYEGM